MHSTINSHSHPIHNALSRNLIFTHGKGGVGKTVVSQAIALSLAKQGARTLWVTLEDPTLPAGEIKQVETFLWHMNCDFTSAFEEYAAMKIGVSQLTRIFLKNKLIQYLSQAAPGVHDLVLLGKIWFERTHYAHIVVDMPSTGYGLALFQSTYNFVKLFRGGPLHRDAQSILETLKEPQSTGHLIVALPEEMPLRESLELNAFLAEIFPQNPAAFLVNRTFPTVLQENQEELSPDSWPSPVAHSIEEYARKRFILENYNMRLWMDQKIPFGKLDFIPPPPTNSSHIVVQELAKQIQAKAYV